MRTRVFAIPARGRTGSRCAWQRKRNVCERAFMPAPTAAGYTLECKRNDDLVSRCRSRRGARLRRLVPALNRRSHVDFHRPRTRISRQLEDKLAEALLERARASAERG